MNLLAAFRVTAVLALGITSLSVRAANFSGQYEANEEGTAYTMTLQQSGSAVTGTAEGDGAKFELSGTAKGDVAEGDFKVAGLGVSLKFRATLAGESLTLLVGADLSDGDTYHFKRKGGAKAVDEPKEKVLAKFSKAPSAVLKGGKEYTHPSGGKFRYPADWKLEELEGALRLTPPGAGTREVYLIVGEPAGNVTDPSTPAILAYLDQQVQGSIPGVKRTGNPETTASGAGKGVILSWGGEANGPILVRGYVTILKGFGIALLAAGPKADIEKRDPELRQIFQTFGWGQGKLDTSLIGSWSHWSYKGSGGYGRETKAYATLAADGTFTYSSDSESSGNFQGKNSQGDVTWTGGLASRSGSGWKGRWTAGGGMLILNFEDGSSETFTYRFKQEGANTFLMVRPSGGGAELEWSRKS
jgi:hypothetical protein